MNYHNLLVNGGIDLSITGMLVVYIGLVAISVIFNYMPLFLGFLERYIPEEVPVAKVRKRAAAPVAEDEAVAVAVALSFHKNTPNL